MGVKDITRGDTWTRTIYVPQVGGGPYDFTGMTLWWTLKEQNDHADNDDGALASLYWVAGGASSGISVPNPADGNVIIKLTKEQTETFQPMRRYRYDLQSLTASGDGDGETLDAGTVFVERDTTRRWTTP